MIRALLLAPGIVVALLAGRAPTLPASAMTAGAFAFDCADPPEDDVNDLFTVTPTPAADGAVSGAAPLLVTVAIRGGVVVFEGDLVGATLNWGDGTGTSTVAATPCGDGGTYWPEQALTHTYTVPGAYTPMWTFTLDTMTMTVPAGFVQVNQVAATAAPTAVSTPTPIGPSPTSPVPGTASTEPAATPVEGSPAPQATPSAPASTASPATPEAASTPTTGSTAAITPASASSPSPRAGGGRSEIVDSIPGPEEISRDPDVILTNLAVAGVTVWVLFSSVFLNQALQDNRSEIERRTAWLGRPWRRFAGVAGHTSGTARAVALGGVLVITGTIYSLLEPGFGLNRATATLFIAAVLGVGVVTFMVSGLEAWRSRAILGAPAAVRVFPACMVIAAASVTVSRLLSLQPGVMYGFVASCALLAPADPSPRDEGRVAIAPVTATLALVVAAWLLVWPLRSLSAESGSWGFEVAEATAVVIFIGGIESVVANMLPLSIMDGGKVFRWSPLVWVCCAVVAAFLTWHVLMGREREYFSGLREASSLAVLTLFLAYTGLSAAIWAYFKFRTLPAGQT